MNEKNRGYITTLIFIALLMLGPVQPYNLAARLFYLIFVPAAFWVSLKWCAERWPVNAELDERIHRALTASLSGVFFAIAYHELTLTHHMECSQWIPNHDGQECVGDDVVAKGADFAEAAISIFFGFLTFWYAIAERREG